MSVDDDWEPSVYERPTVKVKLSLPDLFFEPESDEDTPLFSPPAEILSALRRG